tara:strand:+ start:28369 stop:28557 length:189 start_codon:yes stop_codon:yes gene_type:complete
MIVKYKMPFSFFAARCLYVAKQPLKYRKDVIRRIYAARVASHATLITAVKGPDFIALFPLVG